MRHFLPLAERLGQIYTALAEGLPRTLEIEYAGQISDSDTRILTLSVLKGVFGGVTDEPVSYVNAPRIAAERGVEVRDTSTATAHDYVNLISILGGDHAIGGTLVGLRGEPRRRDARRPHDRPAAGRPHAGRAQRRPPGMIAFVSGVLADAGVNIDDMHLGRSPRARPPCRCSPPTGRCPPRCRT